MDIREEIRRDYSKPACVRIAEYIGSDKDLFSELMNVFLYDEWIMTQRAAWVVSHCADEYPELIKPWIGKMIKILKKKDIHVAVKRNSVRVLQFVDIPEKHMGNLADICFNFLSSASETIAVKVFSMTILYNITLKIPELKNELLPLIEDQMPYGSAGFKNRGQKIINALNKMP